MTDKKLTKEEFEKANTILLNHFGKAFEVIASVFPDIRDEQLITIMSTAVGSFLGVCMHDRVKSDKYEEFINVFLNSIKKSALATSDAMVAEIFIKNFNKGVQ